MKRLLKKALAISLVFSLVVVLGASVVPAEPNDDAGIHIEIDVFSSITDMPTEQQEQIDKMLAIMYENGIDNLQDLSVFLQTIVPYSCPGGSCAFISVWVTINGVRRPANMCTTCGRLVILP
ncbi:MAG: hypothetical protein FWF80_04585 [Defluviitaleaceae bacterium]|nr:hypothetical protein [Defluviitaleaceae bacterium]